MKCKILLGVCRYETNVVYPPIYGGVYHASPFAINEMNGGDFMLNMEGLDHYRRFGYKGRLCCVLGVWTYDD